MKKFTTIFVIICVICATSLILTSCNKNKCADGHTWELNSTTATCFDGGNETYFCKICKTTKTEKVNAYGHDYVLSSRTEPTCKTNGQQVLKCSKCEYTETKTLLPIEHDYIEKSKTPSTCSQHGTQVLECSMCHTQTTKELPLLNHNYELISETPSTCTIKGVKNYKCKDCDDIYMEELELLRHQYTTINTATCFLNGKLKNICKDCQHEEIIEDIVMLEHDFGTDGYCSKCGIYKTLIDIDDLNVTSKRYNSSAGAQGSMVTYPHILICGNLTPKFKKENKIPYTYFEKHKISLTTYLYDKDNQSLGSITTLSTINYEHGNYQYTMTLQYGGFINGLANQFRLDYATTYANLEVFTKEALINATSFKLEISCEGYEKIEKTYQLIEN